MSREVMVPVPGGELRAVDHPGHGPAVVALHGFPDDSAIYARLADALAPRRFVSLDFLGYGRSSRPGPRPVAPGQREAELAAVIDALELGEVVLVGHDSGGPVAVNHALARPATVAGLVLLNTYYGHAPTLRFPDLIQLLGDPDLRDLARAVIAEPAQRQWPLWHTRQCFGYERDAPDTVAAVSIQPQFFGSERQPDALAAILDWTAELREDVALQDERIAAGELARLSVPVTLAFGVHDAYLNPGVARHIGGHLRSATVVEIDDASHWPQWDQPAAVARIVEQLA